MAFTAASSKLTPMPPPVTRLPPSASTPGAVLIPVKAFEDAKGRLSDALTPGSRAQLAQSMATRLIGAQGDLTVAVCCDDEGVATWAESVGASVIWCPGTDLNGAVQQGFAALCEAGYASIAVAHSDLPLAASLAPLLGWHGVTVVPDRHRTGSNVLVVPAAIDYHFSYGAGSYQRHVAEAVRHRCGLRIVHDADLGWDVDNPDDLAPLESSTLSDLLDRKPES